MTPPPGAGARARTTAPGRRPPGPRRVSGPARRPVQAPVAAPPLRRLVDHPLLDRLIRGRTWIGIVAFALIGIVGMQVALLRLNAGIGQSVQRAAVLSRENSLLSAQVSTRQAGDLRQAEAAQRGMVFAPPGDVRYLNPGRSDAAQAAASIVPPASQSTGGLGGSSSQGAGGIAPASGQPAGDAAGAVAGGAGGN